MTGKLDPDTENPVPDTAADFTVTAAVPLDVKVTVCTASLFNATEPNEMLVALTVRVGVCCVDAAGFNWISMVAFLLVPFSDCAVIYTVSADDTNAIFALNATDDAPAFT